MYGMLAKFTGSGYVLWWQLVLLPFAIGIPLFGGGALLMVGGKYIAKSPRAGYWRSVGTVVLYSLASGAIAGVVIAVLIALSGAASGPVLIAGLLGLLIAAVASLLVTWLIIKGMFRVSFGRAILAWLPTLGLAVFYAPMTLAVLVPALGSARDAANRAVCASNLSSITKSMILYKTDHDDHWPPDLEALSRAYRQSPDLYRCPCRQDPRPAGRTSDYFYLSPRTRAADERIVACDYAGNHSDGSRNVLLANCGVRRMSAEEFQAALAKPENAAFAAALEKAEHPPGQTPSGGD